MQAKKSKKKRDGKVRDKKIKQQHCDLRWYFLLPKEWVKEVNTKTGN